MAATNDNYLITNCVLIKDKKAIVINDLKDFIPSRYFILGGYGANNAIKSTMSIKAVSQRPPYRDGFDYGFSREGMK